MLKKLEIKIDPVASGSMVSFKLYYLILVYAL
jgi:hypothetical protein